MKLFIPLMLVALIASAETKHEDGSVTLTKEEQQAILEYVRKIQLESAMWEKKATEEPKPAKCI